MVRKMFLAAAVGCVVLAAGAVTAEAGRCYRGGGYGYGGGQYYQGYRGGYAPRVSYYHGYGQPYYRAPYQYGNYRGGYGYGYGYPRSGVSFSIGF